MPAAVPTIDIEHSKDVLIRNRSTASGARQLIEFYASEPWKAWSGEPSSPWTSNPLYFARTPICRKSRHLMGRWSRANPVALVMIDVVLFYQGIKGSVTTMHIYVADTFSVLFQTHVCIVLPFP